MKNLNEIKNEAEAELNHALSELEVSTNEFTIENKLHQIMVVAKRKYEEYHAQNSFGGMVGTHR